MSATAERRLAYRVERDNDGVPVLQIYDVVVTERRITLTLRNNGGRAEWETSDSFPRRFTWEPIEAWQRHLTRIRTERARALAALAALDKETAVAVAAVGA